MPTPIALFAFNRPVHLTRTLTALAANELANESDLYIFCDGARSEKEAPLCEEVVQVAQQATGFKSVTVYKQQINRGLAPSIINGVSKMVAAHGQVIVLEDDLITSPYFLRYMNDGLQMYVDNPKVASIHGWCFPHNVHNPPQTFFLRGGDCWGWATWKRAWDVFEPDGNKLLAELRHKNLIAEFDLDGSYGYSSMLEQAAKGVISSWAIRWHASTFLADMYTLHPGKSLVHNVGLDNSGTHCSATHAFDVVISKAPVPVLKQTVLANPLMQQVQNKFYKRPSINKITLLLAKAKRITKDCIPPILLRAAKKIFPSKQKNSIIFQGNYPDWQNACAACGTGYSSEAIFARVLESARAVRDSEALWERDSVLFYHEEYNWPLVAGLMAVAAKHKGNLHVLDFGGALGSTFQQNKRILQILPSVSWHIVEQPHVVECGKQQFTTATCTFHENMKDCFVNAPINVVLFSGVLQYMPEPYALLQEALDNKPDAILIDRTPFLPDSDKITVQHVPEAIYPAQYPCWWLNRSHIAFMLATSYNCFPDYESPVDPNGFYGFMAIKKEAYAPVLKAETF